MLLDAISEIELFVYVFSTVYVIVLIAYILTSWIRLPYSLQPVQRFLYDVCEPYLRIWRRILPRFGADRPQPDGRDHRRRDRRPDRHQDLEPAVGEERPNALHTR